VNISVAILQGLYLSGQGSFVTMLALLPHKLHLYKFIACQHFTSCRIILFGSVEGTLSKGSRREIQLYIVFNDAFINVSSFSSKTESNIIAKSYYFCKKCCCIFDFIPCGMRFVERNSYGIRYNNVRPLNKWFSDFFIN